MSGGRVLSILETIEKRRREAQLERIRELLRRINGRMETIRALGRIPFQWDDE